MHDIDVHGIDWRTSKFTLLKCFRGGKSNPFKFIRVKWDRSSLIYTVGSCNCQIQLAIRPGTRSPYRDRNCGVVRGVQEVNHWPSMQVNSGKSRYIVISSPACTILLSGYMMWCLRARPDAQSRELHMCTVKTEVSEWSPVECRPDWWCSSRSHPELDLFEEHFLWAHGIISRIDTGILRRPRLAVVSRIPTYGGDDPRDTPPWSRRTVQKGNNSDFLSKTWKCHATAYLFWDQLYTDYFTRYHSMPYTAPHGAQDFDILRILCPII